MTTLGDVTKKRVEPSAEAAAAAELVRLVKEQGLSLTGPDGPLKQFTKTVLETALNEEMTEHLGHDAVGLIGAARSDSRQTVETMLLQIDSITERPVNRNRAAEISRPVICRPSIGKDGFVSTTPNVTSV